MKTKGVASPQRIRSHEILRLIVTTAGLLFIADVSVAVAQGGKNLRTVSHSRERMQELIKDYSDSIGIDDEDTRPTRSDRRGLTVSGDVDVKVLHPLIRGWATKLTNLAYVLNDQSNQVPGLRKVYTETLRLSGTSTGILKRMDKFGLDGQMMDELQQLDADWHELAYRLESIRGLSNEAKGVIAEIGDLDKQVHQAIGITQQLDRRQLGIKVASLTADLDNLQSDIALELGQSQDAQAYRKSINRVRQIVSNLVTLIRDQQVENREIVEEFEHFESHWKPLAEKLQTEDDRYIERSVYRIASTTSDVHQLLLLPQKADASQFLFLAKALKKDLDQFFERTPLVLVISLPHSKEALPVAEKLHKACDKFIEAVEHGHQPEEIYKSFQAVEQAQRAFTDVYRDIDSDRAIAVLNRMNQDINSIRSSLQIPRDEFDDRSIEELAGAIQNYTEKIAIVSRRWLDRDEQPNADEWLQEANDLARSAEHLHDEIANGARLSDLKEEMSDLYERCRRVYSHLAKCRTEERQTLVRISSNLTPAITELRSMILH